MKIVVPFDEIKFIVENYLRGAKELPVVAGSGAIVSHVEGQYEDSREVVEGLSFELK